MKYVLWKIKIKQDSEWDYKPKILDHICLESEKQNNLWQLIDLALRRDHKLLNH